MNMQTKSRSQAMHPFLKSAAQKLRFGRNFTIIVTLTALFMICGVMMGAARFSTQLTVRDSAAVPVQTASRAEARAMANDKSSGGDKVFFTSYSELADEQSETISYDSIKTLLLDKGYALAPEDKLEFSQSEEGREVFVDITRAFPVRLTASGVTKEIMTTASTVSALLDEAGLSYDEDDILNPAPSASLTADSAVTLQTVSYKEVTTEEAIPFTTESTPSPTLKKGEEKVAVQGEEGLMATRTMVKYMDGNNVSSEVLAQTVTKEPVAQKIYTGVATVNVNPNTAAHVDLDNSGNPVSYSKVISGKSAAYSARAGAKTASGRPAVVGHVAVDPKVIPYGTKLYIKSSDSSDVYGYAIAADTGAALLDGRIIVDLFFGSYDESCDWGIHQVDIFVLD